MTRPLGPAAGAVSPQAIAELPSLDGQPEVAAIPLTPGTLRVAGSPLAPLVLDAPSFSAPPSVRPEALASLEALADRVLADGQGDTDVRAMMQTVRRALKEQRTLAALRLMGSRA